MTPDSISTSLSETPGKRLLKRHAFVVAAWVASMFLGCVFIGVWNYQTLHSGFTEESRALHRTLSQRADQHDAHLTALSAIAQAPLDTGHALFRDVAGTISRFYPRIDDIALVPLDGSLPATSIRPENSIPTDHVRSTAQQLGTTVAIESNPMQPGHYIMVKRSPNNANALYGVVLNIDARRLADDVGAFWQVPTAHLQLSLPDGTALMPAGTTSPGFAFSQTLGSASQPLRLDTHKAVNLTDLFPATALAVLLGATGTVSMIIGLMLRQRQRIRSAMEGARISSVESRLAHASRVNALGEMAAGMAHELTQPLTAILSQAQAGRRLLVRGNHAGVAEVLDETVSQAQRASAILQRLRNWSRPQGSAPVAFDLRDALATVRALMTREAESRRILLGFHMPDTPVMICADPVEMEQVVFNLIRNAFEALSETRQPRPAVNVSLRLNEGKACLDIVDNGAGVAESVRARLFTPFTTTRVHGTGLGLTLSQRLVERAGGQLQLLDGTDLTTFRVTFPCHFADVEKA